MAQQMAEVREMVRKLGVKWECRDCHKAKRGLSPYPMSGDTLSIRASKGHVYPEWLAETLKTTRLLCRSCRGQFPHPILDGDEVRRLMRLLGTDKYQAARAFDRVLGFDNYKDEAVPLFVRDATGEPTDAELRRAYQDVIANRGQASLSTRIQQGLIDGTLDAADIAVMVQEAEAYEVRQIIRRKAIREARHAS